VNAVTDVEPYRRALLAERTAIAHAIEYLHVEHPGSIEDETQEVPASSDNHLAETATATVDREIDYSLEENAEQVLGEIDAALQRIDDGRYGSCADCGGPIGEERLEALPWASLCIGDARKRSR
jgi:RNA polymerase-binding transcription factor